MTLTEARIIEYIARSSCGTATHLIARQAGCRMAQVRYRLHKLAALGLTEPVRSSGGLALWWKATDAGRDALAKMESRS